MTWTIARNPTSNLVEGDEGPREVVFDILWETAEQPNVDALAVTLGLEDITTGPDDAVRFEEKWADFAVAELTRTDKGYEGSVKVLFNADDVAERDESFLLKITSLYLYEHDPVTGRQKPLPRIVELDESARFTIADDDRKATEETVIQDGGPPGGGPDPDGGTPGPDAPDPDTPAAEPETGADRSDSGSGSETDDAPLVLEDPGNVRKLDAPPPDGGEPVRVPPEPPEADTGRDPEDGDPGSQGDDIPVSQDPAPAGEPDAPGAGPRGPNAPDGDGGDKLAAKGSWTIVRKSAGDIVEGDEGTRQIDFDIKWDLGKDYDRKDVRAILALEDITTGQDDAVRYADRPGSIASQQLDRTAPGIYEGSISVVFDADERPEFAETFQLGIARVVWWETDPKTWDTQMVRRTEEVDVSRTVMILDDDEDEPGERLLRDGPEADDVPRPAEDEPWHLPPELPETGPGGGSRSDDADGGDRQMTAPKDTPPASGDDKAGAGLGVSDEFDFYPGSDRAEETGGHDIDRSAGADSRPAMDQAAQDGLILEFSAPGIDDPHNSPEAFDTVFG